MTGKLFPIISETSCRSKWAWSSLYLNSGTTASCHRASGSPIPDDFDSFHNTPEKLRDRQLMVNGKWPGAGCEYCRELEQAGGKSDRQFQNQIPDVWPQELVTDPTATAVEPVVLEVFFNNTCNLACVYCNANLSSKIQAEQEKFDGISISADAYQDQAPKFWSWIERNGTRLKRLQILGGEPLLQRDFERLLEFYEHAPAPDLEFNIVTNAVVPEKIWKSKIDRLAALVKAGYVGRVDLQLSIDSWGKGQEYVRWGFDPAVFENNLRYAQQQHVFRIGLLSTFTSLSLLDLPALAAKYIEWNRTSQVFWYMHLVLPVGESVFEPVMFDYGVFESSLEAVNNMLPARSWDDQRTVEVFQGIMQKLKTNCKDNPERRQQLLNFLNKNDQRRQTNWKETFPWLISYLDNSYVVF